MALGFIAGRLTGWLTTHVSARWTFVIYAAYVTLAAALLAVVPGALITTLGSMDIVGFGVGGASAIMPRRVLDGVPRQETSSVLSINQIVRTVGFSVGSALVGLLLATTTPAGDLPPQEHRYTIAAIDVLPLFVIRSGPSSPAVAGQRTNQTSGPGARTRRRQQPHGQQYLASTYLTFAIQMGDRLLVVRRYSTCCRRVSSA